MSSIKRVNMDVLAVIPSTSGVNLKKCMCCGRVSFGTSTIVLTLLTSYSSVREDLNDV